MSNQDNYQASQPKQREVVDVTIVDGIKTTTYKDGSQRFEPVSKEAKEEKAEAASNKSWWRKIVDWLENAHVKPCVKVRDLEDPFGDRKRGASDGDANSKVKSSVEIGVKVEF